MSTGWKRNKVNHFIWKDTNIEKRKLKVYLAQKQKCKRAT